MRLGLPALVLLLLVGCHYDNRDVTCDPIATGCGGGEVCAVSGSEGPTCSCGDVTSSSRACAAGTTCSSGACIANLPPSAVISNAVNGALRVASNTSVGFSGRDSSDPEGAPLTYRWSFDGRCGSSPPTVALDTRDITIDTSGIADGCTVTLTVSDDLGESGTASATITLHVVGGHVSQKAVGCVDAYDPSVEEPQGTEGTPFCDIIQAVRAAADNNLLEVSAIADDKFLLAETLDVSGLSIVGGYTVTSGTWTPGTGKTILSAADGASGPVILLSGGTTRLTNVSVQRTTACGNSCVALEVNGAQATLSATDVLASAGASGTITAVYVHGDDTTTQLTLTNATTIATTTARTAYGLDIDGPGTVTIDAGSGISVTSATVFGTGLRIAGHANVQITGGVKIKVVGPGNTGTMYGILDGRNNALDVMTPCPGLASCNASDTIVMSAVSITVTNAFTLYGAAFFGSKDVRIDSASTITADGAPHVEALASMDVRSSFVVNDTVVTATGFGTRSELDFVFAYQDGYIDTSASSSVVRNGSKGLVMNSSVQLIAIASGTLPIESYAAMLLATTDGGTFTGTSFRVSGTLANARVTGAVITYGTKSLRFEAGRFAIDGVTATSRIASFADGCSSAMADDPTCDTNTLASTNLTLHGNVFEGVLHAIAPFGSAKRACLLLGGTKQSSVTQNMLNCTPEIATFSNDVVTWLWAFKTDTVDITDNTITSLTHATNGLHRTWYIGILDGLYPLGSQTNPELDAYDSSKLTLNRNSIVINEPDSNVNVAGVWYRGQADTDHFTNNAVDVRAQQSYGVILDRSKTVLGLNTIRATCVSSTSYAPCTGYGTAVYILRGAGRASQIIGNLLTTEPYNATDSGTFVIDAYPSGADSGIELLAYNQFALSGAHASDGPEPELFGFLDTSSDRPTTPNGAETSSDLNTIAAVSGAKVDANVRSKPTICDTLKDVVDADDGTNHVPVNAVADAVYQVDRNNVTRDVSSGFYDCGAAERSLACAF